MALLQDSTLHAIIFTAVLTTIPVLCGVQMIPERVKVAYRNEKYFPNYSIAIKRYSRKSPYFINAEFTTNHQWNNNITFNLIFYEFLHNEYRRSFIELHYKYCDLLNYEKYFGARVLAYGIKCPQPAGAYKLLNFTIPMDEFPNVFPFEHARTDFEFSLTATGETILKLHFYAQFKNIVHKN